MKRVLIAIAMVTLVAMGAHGAGASNEGDPTKAGGAPQGTMGHMGPGGMMGGGMMRESMMGGGAPSERPLLSLALQQRDALGLSEEQVKALEVARSAFEKEAIRRGADVQIAERELSDLLRESPVDLGKVEAKVRQIAGLSADLRFTRIKTIEKGKTVLTADQLKKLMSAAGSHGGPMTDQGGAQEMRRFMNSERAPQAMASMMEMARRMGNGDTMRGMVRMMEMMGSMENMMGPSMGAPTPRAPSAH